MQGFKHFPVAHNVGEYVRGQAHTNGIESFWALLRRRYIGIYHQMSVQHLYRYVNDFAHRHNTVNVGMLPSMMATIVGMAGRRLSCKELVR